MSVCSASEAGGRSSGSPPSPAPGFDRPPRPPSIVIREAKPEDLDYVIASWSRWLHRSHPELARLRMRERLRLATSRVVERLARHGVRVRVACYDLDPDFLVGWLADDGDVLLACYVRGAYRGIGIGAMLVGDVSRYRSCASRMRGRPPRLRFDQGEAP